MRKNTCHCKYISSRDQEPLYQFWVCFFCFFLFVLLCFAALFSWQPGKFIFTAEETLQPCPVVSMVLGTGDLRWIIHSPAPPTSLLCLHYHPEPRVLWLRVAQRIQCRGERIIKGCPEEAWWAESGMKGNWKNILFHRFLPFSGQQLPSRFWALFSTLNAQQKPLTPPSSDKQVYRFPDAHTQTLRACALLCHRRWNLVLAGTG